MPIGLAVLWNSLPVALFLLALGKWILDAKLQTKYGWWCMCVCGRYGSPQSSLNPPISDIHPSQTPLCVETDARGRGSAGVLPRVPRGSQPDRPQAPAAPAGVAAEARPAEHARPRRDPAAPSRRAGAGEEVTRVGADSLIF